ncbi:MAG: hypothetical protein K0B14_17835 [Anaerolineaceae bacterium]|nr:hypothetical protein [Anaerolineaceae bacterium]
MKPAKRFFIRTWRCILIGSSILLLLIVVPVLAQTGGGFDLSWSNISGGGGSSIGGTYVLDGVVGQPDAGVLSGGDYSLGGGFWGGGEINIEPEDHNIFLPLVVR